MHNPAVSRAAQAIHASEAERDSGLNGSTQLRYPLRVSAELDYVRTSPGLRWLAEARARCPGVPRHDRRAVVRVRHLRWLRPEADEGEEDDRLSCSQRGRSLELRYVGGDDGALHFR